MTTFKSTGKTGRHVDLSLVDRISPDITGLRNPRALYHNSKEK